MNQKRTNIFLTANLGPEVTRIYDALAAKDQLRAEAGYKRFCGIADQIDDNDEILILKDVVGDLVAGKGNYQIDKESLQAYFIPFMNKVLRDQGLS